MRLLLTLFGCLLLTGCGGDESSRPNGNSQTSESTSDEAASDRTQDLKAQHACVIFHQYPDGVIQIMELVNEGEGTWGGEKKIRRNSPDEELELTFEFELREHKNGKDIYAINVEWSVMRKVEGKQLEGGARITGEGEGGSWNSGVYYDGNPVKFDSDEHGETWLMSRQAAIEKRALAKKSQSLTTEEEVED